MMVPSDGLIVTQDVDLQPGVYHLPSGLTISGNNITLNGHGAALIGGNGRGRGIAVQSGNHVTIKNVRLFDYYHGIYAQQCENLTIANCQVKATAEIPANTNFLDIWKRAEQAYGGGIFLWQVQHSHIQHNDLQHQMNGLLTYHCRHLDVSHNIANYCSGFGFHLFETNHSVFSQNYADYCCRSFIHNQHGYLGADAAGFLIVHSSCHNIFRRNYARLGGDGFFLSGLSSGGEHVGCDCNLFEENDGSYSPNNAFEATFSRGNEFKHNKATHSNYGFWLGFSTEVTLEHNQIGHNHQAGIAVENGVDMIARENDIWSNQYGILLWSKYVEQFARAVPENDTSRNWHIEHNRFSKNDVAIRIAAHQDHGVRLLPRNLQRSPLPRQHVLQHNQIRSNRVGIELYDTLGSVTENNQMHDNVSDRIILS